MRPMTPAPRSLLAAAGILAVAGSLALTGAQGSARAAALGAARVAPHSAVVTRITSVSSFKYSADQSTLYGPPLGASAQALYDSAQHR